MLWVETVSSSYLSEIWTFRLEISADLPEQSLKITINTNIPNSNSYAIVFSLDTVNGSQRSSQQSCSVCPHVTDGGNTLDVGCQVITQKTLP